MGGCRQHFGDIGFLKYKKFEVEKMAGEIFFQNRRIFAGHFLGKVLEIGRNFVVEKMEGCVKNVLHLLEP